jgi:hypothetical protein
MLSTDSPSDLPIPASPPPALPAHRVAIAHVEYGSTLGFSFVVGTLISFVPSLLLVLTAKWLVAATRTTMERWVDREVLSIMGQPISVNLIEVLGLTDQLARLQAWDALGGLAVIFALLLLSLLGGLLLAVLVGLVTAAYNVTASRWRGIQIDLRAVE